MLNFQAQLAERICPWFGKDSPWSSRGKEQKNRWKEINSIKIN